MILFKEDWNRYPSAIPDFKTKNKTFLEYAEKLRLMGVENHLFPLSLLNPRLQGVDPFDPLLSVDMKTAIFLECKENIWYYLREVHRVPPVAGIEGVPFRAHRGNMAFAWCCMLHLSVGLTLPRQTGKSIVADALLQWAKDVASVNSLLVLITKDMQLKDRNIEKLKIARKLLPDYIANIDKKDADNSIEMTNLLLGNTLNTVVGQPTIDGANKAARGLTAPIFSFDEAPFTKNINIMLSAALPAYIQAAAEAKRLKKPHWVAYTTTAGKIDTPEGNYMYKVLHGGMHFNETLFDAKNEKDAIDMVTRQSTGDAILVYINFQYYQLGYSDEWLYNALALTHSSGADADRDYFNIWTNGTSSHPFSKKIIDSITSSRMDPVNIELFKRSYIINWYITEEQLKERVATDKKMIAGIDMSEGIGKDFIAMTIVAEEDLSVLGTFAIRETNILNFIEWLSEMMVKYPNLILIPENKSTGVVLIDGLLIKLSAMGIDPFKRIYNRIIDENKTTEERYKLAKEPMSKRPSSFYEQCKTLFGYRTSGGGAHARNNLYISALQKAGAYGSNVVRDSALITEICAISVKDGRLDHSAGLNDDRVVSWLLAVWFLTHSKNLDYYGIKNALKTAVDINSDEANTPQLTEYEQYKKDQDKVIRDEINALLKKIEDSTNNLVISQYTHQIMTLEKKLSNTEILAKSVDELVKESLNIRQNRINQNSNRPMATHRTKIGAYYLSF